MKHCSVCGKVFACLFEGKCIMCKILPSRKYKVPGVNLPMKSSKRIV